MTSGARLTRRASELTDRTSRRLNFPLILPARSQSYSFLHLPLPSLALSFSCLAPFRHSAVPILPRAALRPCFTRARFRSFSLARLVYSPTPRVRYPMNIYAVCNLIPRTRKEDVFTPLVANLVFPISTKVIVAALVIIAKKM